MDTHVLNDVVDLLILFHIQSCNGVFMRFPLVNHVDDQPLGVGGRCYGRPGLVSCAKNLHIWSMLFADSICPGPGKVRAALSIRNSLEISPGLIDFPFFFFCFRSATKFTPATLQQVATFLTPWPRQNGHPQSAVSWNEQDCKKDKRVSPQRCKTPIRRWPDQRTTLPR